MKKKQNLHTHSTYADGKDTPEEIIVEAIDRGFESIGFSEHSYMYFSDYPLQMTPEKTKSYKSEITSLKSKYKGIIDIFCGMEYEMFSDVPNDVFDYLIGSLHYLDIDGNILGFDRGLQETLDYVKLNFGGDGLKFAKKYFETLIRLPEKGNFDILGHFDIITKNNEKGKFIDVSCREYLNCGFEAIHALRGKIPFFEVNTGAISRKYRTSPYPQMEFLREFKNCGYGAIISSDCHDKSFIDCHFDESEELLRAAGYSSRFILTDNGFEEIGL